MKKISHTIIILIVPIVMLTGCQHFLDRETDSFIDQEMTFISYDRTSRFLTNAYDLLPDGFHRIGSEAMFDAATDDGEHANESASIQDFNRGSWNSLTNPDNVWDRYYAGIRITNEFLENVDQVDLDRHRLDPNNQTEYNNRLKDIRIWKAEARFLRAFFHFELLKRYGPIPIVTSTLDIEADYSEEERPTMDACVAFIADECDSAANELDVNPWRDATSALGRATKGAALALKSRMLLYAASPLYLDWTNTSESSLPTDPEKWAEAAAAAKEVIDLGAYTLHGNYRALFQNAFQNSEHIFMRRYGNDNTFETINFPISYGGRGGLNPSLNLVNAYERKDGTPFDWNNDNHAHYPHFFRDDRLQATLILNDSLWQNSRVETWIGGKDGQFNTNATKTGYYLKKFANEEVNLITGGSAAGHTWPLFRLAEIYLNYAEALNEYDPGNADIATYVNAVRQRANQPELPPTLGQEEMRQRIQQERRVELAFEEHRAWDVRRWKIGSSTLGADLLGLEITQRETPRASSPGGHQNTNTSTLPFPASEVPTGWYYYDGDEFNGAAVDRAYWGIYGTPGISSGYGQPNGMIQTYRPEQIAIVNDGAQRVARITSTRDDNPPPSNNPDVSDRPGWWSGGLSSRDTDQNGYPSKFYPLFSRLEVRAKLPYTYGVWHAFWLRHYLGASIAEIDIQEFFVKEFENTASPVRLSQALHILDNQSGNLAVNLNGYERHTALDFNPSEEYHVYGVQIDPDPRDPENHAIITYLLDGEPTNTFETYDYGDRYNTFIKRAKDENRLLTTWDFAITGQIGGPDNFGIGYPEDRDPDLRNLTTEIDWVRVFTREDLASEVPEGPNPPTAEAFDYRPVVVEQRSFESRMYWYPIPESELLRMTRWDQNPGW